MKTESELCGIYADAVERLARHGITVDIDGSFLVFVGEYAEGDKAIGVPESVDGLKAFADALDFARGAA